MIISLGKNLTIKDLNIPSQKFIEQARGKVKIAIIDDEEFIYKEELQRSGFVIDYYEDISNLNALSLYPVIICDIKGVGKDFHSNYEGAFLISQIKKRYPLTEIAAYTGSTYDLSYNAFLTDVRTIKKDIGIEEWCEEIDELIKKVSDPKEIWYKIRNMLLKEDVDLISLAKLEDEYVDIILNKHLDFSNFPSSGNKLKVSQNVLSIIPKLTSSVLYLSMQAIINQ